MEDIMIEKNKDGTYYMNVSYQQKMWADMELYGCEEYGPNKPKPKKKFNPETRQAYSKKRHKAGQAYINSKKTPCEHCGSIENIHFHHVDKSTKIYNVTRMTCWSYKKIQAEIDKCICLCASCHNKHHWATDWRRPT
jgi:hypothetical protein